MIEEASSRVGFLSNRRRFILLAGVLGWGIPCAILFAVVLQIRRGFGHDWYLSRTFLGVLSIAVLLFTGAGVFFGAYLWERLERRRTA